jgi:hypothetical protein
MQKIGEGLDGWVDDGFPVVRESRIWSSITGREPTAPRKSEAANPKTTPRKAATASTTDDYSLEYGKCVPIVIV